MSLPPESLAYAFLQAAQIVAAVLGGQSLADGLLAKVPAPARPAVQDLVYSSLRLYGRGGACPAAGRPLPPGKSARPSPYRGGPGGGSGGTVGRRPLQGLGEWRAA